MSIRRAWALPLTPLYWAGLRAKDTLRALGMVATRRLDWPVISVGSISAGGAGKTPVVIALANLLRAHGHSVDVLSRGYGRRSSETARVDAALPDSADRFGDEPVLISTATGAPVWVGSDRHAAGLAAERANDTRSIHLLDDGFQHRRLDRVVDIALVTAEDLSDALLPAGNRREPLSALRRADAILLREEEAGQIQPKLRRYVGPKTRIYLIRRTLQLDSPPTPHGVLAFSAIARPQGFVAMLKGCGLRVIDSVAFPDHHRYTAADIGRLVQQLKSGDAQAFITTEKDAVKITPELRAILEAAAPLHVAQLRVEFAEPEGILADLEARCR